LVIYHFFYKEIIRTMPITVKDIPEDVRETLKRIWEERKFKISIPEIFSLYVYCYNRAEEVGIADPHTMVIEWLSAEADPSLTFDELKADFEMRVLQEMPAPKELEEVEFWRERARKLEEEIEKLRRLARIDYVERAKAQLAKYKSEIRRLEKELEEARRELEKYRGTPYERKAEFEVRELEEQVKQIKEQVENVEKAAPIKEFEEYVRTASTDELLEAYHAEKPPDIPYDEWIRRKRIIEDELERRGAPKCPLCRRFLMPVRRFILYGAEVPVPPEFHIYRCAEHGFFICMPGQPCKAVTPDAIARKLRMFLPKEITRPTRVAPPKPRIYLRAPAWLSQYPEVFWYAIMKTAPFFAEEIKDVEKLVNEQFRMGRDIFSLPEDLYKMIRTLWGVFKSEYLKQAYSFWQAHPNVPEEIKENVRRKLESFAAVTPYAPVPESILDEIWYSWYQYIAGRPFG